MPDSVDSLTIDVRANTQAFAPNYRPNAAAEFRGKWLTSLWKF